MRKINILGIGLLLAIFPFIAYALTTVSTVSRAEMAKMLAKNFGTEIVKMSRPVDPVNLAEAVKMTVTAAKISIAPAGANEPWYSSLVNFAHNNNIFSKYEILPGKQLTRSKATFLIKQVLLIKNGKKVLSSVRKNNSLACGKNPPKIVPSKITVGGVERSFITSVPSSYDKNKPIKLVFAFHGRTNSNAMVKGYYKVEEAAKGAAIFIYPSGIKAKSGYTWSDPGDKSESLRDYALFDTLLKNFSDNYCINLDQVYVVGHSLGAWFTNSLACARGNVIRAIGSIGGGTSINANCSGPVAAMIWHNPKDNLVPFSDGVRARDQLFQQNMCTNKTKPIEPKAAHCVAYQGCGAFAQTTWCPHTENTDYRGSYYPHTWPKAAGKEIWKFFEGV